MNTSAVKTNRTHSVTKQTLLVAAIIALALLGSRLGSAQEKPKPHEQVLHSFQYNGQDGTFPEAGLIFDAAGNLYGTTYEGGVGGEGTVVELSPQPGGNWNTTILYNFHGGQDGAYPGSSLIFDKAGNLYGTTYFGGSNCDDGLGCGTVFELSPQLGDGWSETILYRFQGGLDGEVPGNSLVFDAAGNLYGTSAFGGNAPQCHHNGCGTVFELSPQAGGIWVETVLYTFQANPDGAEPDGGLIFDKAGNLYGTTLEGGVYGCPVYPGCGTVFELFPQSGGAWAETVLYSFQGSPDGANPLADVIFDTAGNLYGTTALGGSAKCISNSEGCGTVFELSPQSGGGWSEIVLHRFQAANPQDGKHPQAGLTFDALGNLYGTTADGGTGTNCNGLGCGTVFRLSPNSNGHWTEKLFSFNHGDGFGPVAAATFDMAGNLYGTTAKGGSDTAGCTPEGCGTVFEITR